MRYVHQDINGKWLCFEEPVAVVDIYAVINDDKLTKDYNPEIRLTAHAISEALLKLVGKIGLSLLTFVGKGMTALLHLLANVSVQSQDFSPML